MPLKLLQSFLQNRHQRVLLNGQCSSWAPVFAGVPQGSVLGPLFFLIYINDLTKDISSTNKLFADTSIFSFVNDIHVYEYELNSNLRKISMWAYQWKISFNPDVSKQAQEVIFSKKPQKLFHPTVLFNNIPAQPITVQKHLGVYLDEKLNVNTHIREKKIGKASKKIGVIKKLFKSLLRNDLLTIYKSFVRPHLGYGDIIYDRPDNEALIRKLEQVQYNAAVAISGAIKCTSPSKLYKELSLESLEFRRRLRRLCFLHKIISNTLPAYIICMSWYLRNHINT